jgi:hypothetical protein
MTVIASGSGVPYNTSYSFEDPLLHPYQRRADKRLNFILDQLDLGSDANLGYTKVTWLPDEIVRVRYWAQEGITQPIIVVRVEFQEDFRNKFQQEKLAELLEEIEDEDDDDVPPPRKYIPFMWVGIAAIEHSLAGGFPDNPNCGFWGYPIDPRLCGFDPRQAGAQQVDYDFEHSCESFPGLLAIGGSWASRVGNNAAQQRFFRVNGGQTYVYNQFGIEQGTFQDTDWLLTANGLVQATHTNMIALEHVDTQVTQPVAALGTGLSKLPDGYWKRSIIVAPGGIEFPNGSFGYVNELGGGVAATMSATYSGGTIVSELIPGKYEIQAFSQTFQCECTQARIHIRFVMGDGAGEVTVTDFFPASIGTPPINNRMFYLRDLVLGGNPPCGEANEETVFGPNDGGLGWWEFSVQADVQNGVLSDADTAHRDAPFFGSGCAATPKKGPDFPACRSCSGETTVAPANNLDYPNGIHWLTFNAPGGQSTLDLRGGVLWHMARVAQVDGDGHICRIVLLGNDGAAGACACTPFSYGTNMPALGVSADIPLGSNLTELCGAEQCQVAFGVGEQVVVVGWTNFFGVPCGVLGGDWKLIVTKPHGGHGEDFTSLFWSDLRCGEAKAVEEFFAKVEQAFKLRSECSGPPIGVTCAAGNDCTGQLTCTE